MSQLPHSLLKKDSSVVLGLQIDSGIYYTVFPRLDARATIRGGGLFEGGPLNISAGAMGRVALRRDQENARLREATLSPRCGRRCPRCNKASCRFPQGCNASA